MELSTSAINAALVCLKKYEYSQVLKLKQRPDQISVAMRRGTWIHHALQHFHHGKDWRQSLIPLIEFCETAGVDYEGILQETTSIVEGYIDYWTLNQEHPWELVTSEEPIYVDIPGGHQFRATVDTIVRERGLLWLVEHKSTGDIPNQSWRSVDPQTAIQYVCCHLSGKYPVAGVIFNYLWTKTPSVPEVLKNGKGFYKRNYITNTKSFNLAADNLLDLWAGEEEDYNAYIAEARSQFVNDGAFYQRYRVEKPREVLQGTLKDLAVLVRQLEDAERTGYYRRSQSQVSCPRFCSYNKLCALEFQLGKPAQMMRDLEFIVETPESRAEGRIDAKQ